MVAFQNPACAGPHSIATTKKDMTKCHSPTKSQSATFATAVEPPELKTVTFDARIGDHVGSSGRKPHYPRPMFNELNQSKVVNILNSQHCHIFLTMSVRLGIFDGNQSVISKSTQTLHFLRCNFSRRRDAHHAYQ